MAEAERAIELLEAVGDEEPIAEGWRLVGESRMYDGRAAQGRLALERALAGLDVHAAPRSTNAVSFALAMCLVEGPAQEYVDPSISAFSGKPRPHYAEMLEAVRAGEIDRIICWKLDRLYRRPRELEDLIDLALLQSQGQDLIKELDLAHVGEDVSALLGHLRIDGLCVGGGKDGKEQAKGEQ